MQVRWRRKNLSRTYDIHVVRFEKRGTSSWRKRLNQARAKIRPLASRGNVHSPVGTAGVEPFREDASVEPGDGTGMGAAARVV